MNKREYVIELRASGKTYKEITELTGLAKSTINYYCAVDGKGNAMDRQKARRRNLKIFVEEYKSSRGCKTCGETHPACLDFHHRDSEGKSYTISNFIADRKPSIKTLMLEIEKCDIECANCHRKIHYNPDGHL